MDKNIPMNSQIIVIPKIIRRRIEICICDGVLSTLAVIKVVGDGISSDGQRNAVVFVLFEKNVYVKVLNGVRVDGKNEIADFHRSAMRWRAGFDVGDYKGAM